MSALLVVRPTSASGHKQPLSIISGEGLVSRSDLNRSTQKVLAQVCPDLNGGWSLTETITLTTYAQFRWVKGPTSAELTLLTIPGIRQIMGLSITPTAIEPPMSTLHIPSTPGIFPASGAPPRNSALNCRFSRQWLFAGQSPPCRSRF